MLQQDGPPRSYRRLAASSIVTGPFTVEILTVTGSTPMRTERSPSLTSRETPRQAATRQFHGEWCEEEISTPDW